MIKTLNRLITGVSIALTALGGSLAIAAPAQVVLLRHGEKPAQGDDLDAQGYQRAQALVGYFETTPALNEFGPPAAIYAMARAHSNKGSLRPIETVEPLAEAYGLQVLAPYKKPDYQAAVDAIMNNPDYAGRMVVICWEHDELPLFLQAFGYMDGPTAWDSSADFDRTWILDFNGDTPVRFRDLNQNLLPGDQLTGDQSANGTNSMARQQAVR